MLPKNVNGGWGSGEITAEKVMLGKLRQAVSISELMCMCIIGGGAVRPMCAGLV